MRPPFPALATLGFAALCAASAALAAGEVYKWTDEAGVVQYTDSAPDGRPYETVKTAKSRTAVPVAEDAPAEASLTDPEAAAENSEAAKPGSTQSNCDIARANVESINKYTEVKMDRDGDGTAEILTPEERTAELARSEGLVKIYCPAETGTE